MQNYLAAGANGYFIRGYELLDTDYIVKEGESIEIGTFACKTDTVNVCTSQVGDGAVIGFVPFSGYKIGDEPAFRSGDRIQIDIGTMAIYAMNMPESATCNKYDFIGINKTTGALVFAATEAEVNTTEIKPTNYQVMQSNNSNTPGLIYIKRIKA